MAILTEDEVRALGRLSQVAELIERDWKNISPHARPYLDAMHKLAWPSDMYGWDTAEDIVLRFLCNASGWRGAQARIVKQVLRDIYAN